MKTQRKLAREIMTDLERMERYRSDYILFGDPFHNALYGINTNVRTTLNGP